MKELKEFLFILLIVFSILFLFIGLVNFGLEQQCYKSIIFYKNIGIENKIVWRNDFFNPACMINLKLEDGKNIWMPLGQYVDELDNVGVK